MKEEGITLPGSVRRPERWDHDKCEQYSDPKSKILHCRFLKSKSNDKDRESDEAANKSHLPPKADIVANLIEK